MSAKWINVIAAEALAPGQAHFFDVDDLTIAVFNLQGEYFALEDSCSHDGSRMLSCGVEARFIVHGDRIMCPRHGAEFCIKTGAALNPPASVPITTFPTRVNNAQIQVYYQTNPLFSPGEIRA